MKILIIGSKGFIGSACYSFLSFTNLVVGADVVTDYNDANYHQIDVSDTDFKTIFRNTTFDVCINCSGAASVPDSIVHPLRDFQLNVANVAKLLTAIKDENPHCTFIQLSSAAVYGNPDVLPVTENSPRQPLSPYGHHKKQAEDLCKMYHDFFGIRCYILRIFSAYGPGLRKQLFWDLFNKTQNSNSVSLFGTGEETRDYIFIDDLVKAIYLIITECRSDFEVFNVANGKDVSLNIAATCFLKALSFSGDVVYSNQNRAGDPLYWKADVSKLQKLGYRPEFEIEQGLTKYAEWLRGKE